MRFGTDPAAEAVGAEAVRGQVGLLCFRVRFALIVESQQLVVGSGDVDIRLGNVPFALVVGVIASGAEVIAMVGRVFGSSQYMSGSIFVLAAPGVWEFP